MSEPELPAYCFYKVFEPEPPRQFEVDRHYLLYSAKGAIRLEAEDKVWVLPPSRAAWIPANTPVTIEITHPLTCCSVLYHTDFIPAPTDQCQVITLPPFAREMILHCQRWGPTQKHLDEHALNFFRALAGTCSELATSPSQVWVPKGQTKAMQRALAFTQKNLAHDIRFSNVAEAAHLSQRSLARRFATETGMTWRQMQRRMRMISAIEQLSNVEGQVITIALEVGYNSLSAFNRAFFEFSGQTPTQFRAQHFSSIQNDPNAEAN